jgi:hypothetical protein
LAIIASSFQPLCLAFMLRISFVVRIAGALAPGDHEVHFAIRSSACSACRAYGP